MNRGFCSVNSPIIPLCLIHTVSLIYLEYEVLQNQIRNLDFVDDEVQYLPPNCIFILHLQCLKYFSKNKTSCFALIKISIRLSNNTIINTFFNPYKVFNISKSPHISYLKNLWCEFFFYPNKKKSILNHTWNI